MIKRPSTRKTKSQILELFDELLAEHKALQGQYDELQQEKARLEKKASMSVAISAEDTGSSQEGHSAYTIDSVLGGLALLRTGFGGATSELSAKLTTEATSLQELRNQVEEKRNRLRELHVLEIKEETLETLIQEYLEKSEQFEQELKEKRDSFDETWEAQQKAWQKEREELARTVRERNASQRKARQRDEAEYLYNLQLARALSDEEHDQQMKASYQELETLVEAQEKEWADREEAIATQEKEYAEAKAKVEAMPDELEEATEKGKRAGKEISRRQTSYTANLLAKEEEGNRRVYELRIASLKETIRKQQQQIDNLSAQLNTTVRQTQELAVQSLEGSAHERNFKALKEIVLEQAKTSSKGK